MLGLVGHTSIWVNARRHRAISHVDGSNRRNSMLSLFNLRQIHDLEDCLPRSQVPIHHLRDSRQHRHLHPILVRQVDHHLCGKGRGEVETQTLQQNEERL